MALTEEEELELLELEEEEARSKQQPKAEEKPTLGQRLFPIASQTEQSFANAGHPAVGKVASNLAVPLDLVANAGKAIDWGVNAVTSGAGMWKGSNAAKEAVVEKTPDILKPTADMALSPSTYVGGGFLGKAVRPLSEAQKMVKAGNVAQSILTSQSRPLEKAITAGVSKGIKPTVIGKPSLAKMDAFYEKAGNAIKTIADNRDNIKILDDAGEAVAHPRTAGEMAQAIDQAKKLIYKKYSEMATQAGDAGAQFNTNRIISEIDRVSTDIKHSPKIREYAESLKAEIGELNGASPEIIEARIADLNNSLSGFYDGRVTKAKAQVDASIAKLMREELDNNITGSVGEGYQELKNQYGSLKAIEREVNKRALVNARQNTKGLTDLTDIFTGSDLAAGILTANPMLIARGVAGRGIKEVYKRLNSPDRYIEKMFKLAYERPSMIPSVSAAPKALPPALPQIPMTLRKPTEYYNHLGNR